MNLHPVVCPSCAGKGEVTDSRWMSATVRRRRECKSCGERWTTYEFRIPKKRRVVIERTGGNKPVQAIELQAETIWREVAAGLKEPEPEPDGET